MRPKTAKAKYRLRNWREYTAALTQRGNLTLWVSDQTLGAWHEHARSSKRGAPRTYSDTAIVCLAMLGAVYKLTLRATEGLMASVLELLGIELAVPNYTTLCRRRQMLEVALPRRTQGNPLHMVVDATGIKVYGEGAWKVRCHGWSKRRTQAAKLHLGVDEASGEIVAAVATTNDFSDGQLLPDLLDQIDQPVVQVSGDGAYDTHECYAAIDKRAAQAAIPPRRSACIWQHSHLNTPPHSRHENLRCMRRYGRTRWKRACGYHRRSLAETAIFRVKTIFGDHVRARLFEAQGAELLIRCVALNHMTHLGMPDSYAV
jgi:IS5 family transposase